MKLFFLFVVAFAVGLNAHGPAQSLQDIINGYYCSKELMCERHELAPNGSFISTAVQNVMCNAGKYGQNCQRAECIPIHDGIKKTFLNGHNEMRNLVALGLVGGIFKGRMASRMLTLKWDNELEMMALQNAAQCKVETDMCYRTKQYPYTGQNLYAVWGYPESIPVEYAIVGAIESWFAEYERITTIDCINSFGSSNCPWAEISHFTQMVWDDATAVGCSIVKDTSTYFIACNYSFGNMRGRPVYKIGWYGSQCMKGVNRNYPGLCRESESSGKNGRDAQPVLRWRITGKKCARNGNNNTYIFQ